MALACGGALLLALAWATGRLAAVLHTGAPPSAHSPAPVLLAHLAVVYPYAVVSTVLGYLSHLVLDSLTGPIPMGMAARGSAYRAPTQRAQDPHRLRHRDLARQARDHNRRRPRDSPARRPASR